MVLVKPTSINVSSAGDPAASRRGYDSANTQEFVAGTDQFNDLINALRHVVLQPNLWWRLPSPNPPHGR